MRKLFSANKYLAVTLALAGFAAAGTAPAFTQAATKYGSVIPYHYLADGTQAPGWYPEVPSVRQIAQAPSTNHNGYSAYAQVPATIQPLVPGYSASSGDSVLFGLEAPDRFGIQSQR
jgi:hypothetical protein